MDFLFDLVCGFLEIVLDPIIDPIVNLITKNNREIKNIILRKIAKGIVYFLILLFIIITYMCLSRLIRGYWI